MSGMEVNPSSSLFTHQALNIDIVVDEIISHLGDNPLDLIKYRLVCHKWNNTVVRKINQSRISLKIPLRYGPEVPRRLWMIKSDAERRTRKVLQSVTDTLTGTASRLHFDTVVVDRDFYLAGVKSQWTHFLEIHGKSIRHFKFKLRSGEFPDPSHNHVTDCADVLSMDNLVTAFSATPNLKSLYFSIRFSNYSSESVTQQPKPKPMVLGNLPKLYKLTNVTIRDPKGISYPPQLLKEILGMAPNLTSLSIKPSSVLSTYAEAMKSIEEEIKESLTSLKIGNVHLHGINDSSDMIHFPYLNLTTLELNNIYGVGRNDWIQKLLQAQHTSLVKLILGDRKNLRPLIKTQDVPLNLADLCFVHFPPVMEHLKLLEVNLSKFVLFIADSYQILFPVIESFTWSGATENGENEWIIEHTGELFKFNSGQKCHTLKQFSLIGPIRESDHGRFILGVRLTFPMAECHFHSERDNQYCRKLESTLPYALHFLD